MSENPSNQTGRYLYAVVAKDEAELITHGALTAVSGVAGGPVYTIINETLAAVVSDIPDGRIRPDRRRLTAHHEVLRRLLPVATLLPMAFGTIADGPAAVLRLLSLNEETLNEQLAHVRGKVEMGLRVVWAVPNIFQYFLRTHTELRELSDRLYRAGREPAHDEKIDLGRRFDRLLSADRAAHLQTVREALAATCTEIVTSDPKDEREVLRLACLIPREAQADFEQAVLTAARQFDDNYSFDFNGPWPAFSFVNLVLHTTD